MFGPTDAEAAAGVSYDNSLLGGLGNWWSNTWGGGQPYASSGYTLPWDMPGATDEDRRFARNRSLQAMLSQFGAGALAAAQGGMPLAQAGAIRAQALQQMAGAGAAGMQAGEQALQQTMQRRMQQAQIAKTERDVARQEMLTRMLLGMGEGGLPGSTPPADTAPAAPPAGGPAGGPIMRADLPPAAAPGEGGAFSPAAMRVLTAQESGGRPDARPVDPSTGRPLSSALGPQQFIDGTWLAFARANPDAFPGLDPENRAHRPTILAMRTNPELSARATQWYAGRNAEQLRAAGLPVDDATLALSHFLGGGGATRFLRADPNAPAQSAVSPAAYNANQRVLAGRTVGQVVDSYRARYAGAPAAAGAPPPATATAAGGGAVPPSAAAAAPPLNPAQNVLAGLPPQMRVLAALNPEAGMQAILSAQLQANAQAAGRDAWTVLPPEQARAALRDGYNPRVAYRRNATTGEIQPVGQGGPAGPVMSEQQIRTMGVPAQSAAMIAGLATREEQDQAIRTLASRETKPITEQEDALRGQFQQLAPFVRYGQSLPLFEGVTGALDRVRAGYQPGAQHDQLASYDAVVGLANLLDPGSVVREGEVANVLRAQGVPSYLVSQIERVLGGQPMSQELASQIERVATGRMQAYRRAVDIQGDQYRGLAEARGLNPRAVVLPYGDPVAAYEERRRQQPQSAPPTTGGEAAPSAPTGGRQGQQVAAPEPLPQGITAQDYAAALRQGVQGGRISRAQAEAMLRARGFDTRLLDQGN